MNRTRSVTNFKQKQFLYSNNKTTVWAKWVNSTRNDLKSTKELTIWTRKYKKSKREISTRNKTTKRRRMNSIRRNNKKINSKIRNYKSKTESLNWTNWFWKPLKDSKKQRSKRIKLTGRKRSKKNKKKECKKITKENSNKSLKLKSVWLNPKNNLKSF